MINRSKGFTIVELLIVIVVIGILAAITIVAYNGVQARAQNATNSADLHAWEKLFRMYQATNGEFPVAAVGTYCLGDVSGTNGKCGSYMASSATTYEPNTALNDLLATAGSLPTGSTYPVNQASGTYVDYPSSGLSVILYGVFRGKTGECPAGLEQTYTDNLGRVHCRIKMLK